MHDKMALTENFVVENEICTDDELRLVYDLCGRDIEVCNRIIYARTGYHSVEQLYFCERKNYYFSPELLEAYEL